VINEHSKLLINETPLQVLPSLACLIGLPRAIVLQQIHYLWSQKRGGVMIEGEKYIYNSAREWVEDHFTFWKTTNKKSGKVSGDTVSKHLQWLETNGYLIAKQPHKNTGDMTKYHRIDYDFLDKKYLEFISAGQPVEAPDHLEKNPNAFGEKSKDHLEKNPNGNQQNTTDHLEKNPNHSLRVKTSSSEDLNTHKSKKGVCVEPSATFRGYAKNFRTWWEKSHGPGSCPPDTDPVFEKQIEWLLDEGILLSEVEAFYKFATTHASQISWRKGPVTIATILKEIKGWLAKEKAAAPASNGNGHKPTYCDACREGFGWITIVVNKVPRKSKCKHQEAKQTVKA
jgi:hypothetical protein